MVNTNQLRHFIEVVERGSLAAATGPLGITQSALTRSLQKLEESLGCELLERDRRGARLTAYGESFLDHARAVIFELDRAGESLKAIQGLSEAQVKIGVSPNFLTWILPEAIAAIVARYPGINFRISTATAEDLAAQVKRCDIDLAFCQTFFNPQAKRGGRDPELNFEKLMTARARAFAPAGHPLAGRGAISLAEAAAHAWVVPFKLTINYRFEQAFLRANIPVPVQTINSASISFCKSSARALGLLMLMPEHLMAEDVAAGAMLPIDVPELAMEHDVGLFTRKPANNQPVVRHLAEVLRRLCAEQDGNSANAV